MLLPTPVMVGVSLDHDFREKESAPQVQITTRPVHTKWGPQGAHDMRGSNHPDSSKQILSHSIVKPCSSRWCTSYSCRA